MPRIIGILEYEEESGSHAAAREVRVVMLITTLTTIGKKENKNRNVVKESTINYNASRSTWTITTAGNIKETFTKLMDIKAFEL